MVSSPFIRFSLPVSIVFPPRSMVMLPSFLLISMVSLTLAKRLITTSSLDASAASIAAPRVVYSSVPIVATTSPSAKAPTVPRAITKHTARRAVSMRLFMCIPHFLIKFAREYPLHQQMKRDGTSAVWNHISTRAGISQAALKPIQRGLRLFFRRVRPAVELDIFVQAGVLLLEQVAPSAAGKLHFAAAGENLGRGHVPEGVELAADNEPLRARG